MERSEPGRFGGYLLLEQLGSGSTAEVFRARSLAGGRELALRRLRPELSGDEGRRAQLLHEAEVARGLEHRLFCKVFEVGEADGLPFLTMELASGPRLVRLLRWLQLRGQGAPLGAAVHLCAELCAGLHHAHAPPFGLVHGDVSPGNVLLLKGGEVKLVDAGGAASSGSEGELQGTLGYLAPEQLAGAAPSHLADLYSCAVLLWELLAHQRLFPARTPREALRLRRAALPPIGPAGQCLEETLRRALHLEPAGRWQSGRELRAALLADARRAGALPSAGELAALIASVFGAR